MAVGHTANCASHKRPCRRSTLRWVRRSRCDVSITVIAPQIPFAHTFKPLSASADRVPESTPHRLSRHRRPARVP